MSIVKEREIAKLLGFSQRNIINLRNQGILPYMRIGRSIRYDMEQVQEALKKPTVSTVADVLQ
jgi:excisionase family DNA binding protein